MVTHDDNDEAKPEHAAEDKTTLGLILANDVPHFFIEDHGDPRCGNVTTILGVSGRGVEKIR